MQFPVYSERDLKSGFGFPYCSQNDAYAARDFENRIRNSNSPMKFQPKDFQLFRVGIFDTDKGSIEVDPVPILIADGGDYA